MFMLCTDKKTQFSSDKVINCFIIASAYVSSRLMAGGGLVTGHIGNVKGDAVALAEATGGTEEEIAAIIAASFDYVRTGPVLNPAISFGQMVATFEFLNIQYVVCPIGGSALALIFYEFIFVKS